MATKTLPALHELAAGLRYDLAPLLAAAQELANHQRVHAAVSAAANCDERFATVLKGWCRDWADPSFSNVSNLCNLLRVAESLCGELAQEAELVEQATTSEVAA